MKNLAKSIKITLVLAVFFAISYVAVLFVFSLAFGRGEQGSAEWVTTSDGRVVGAANVGQRFTKDIYFWGRPGGYAADASGGSNKGPTNPEYLAEVEVRIDTFLAAHPYLERSEVPAEMVTASGSGLDPDITPQCAYVQVKRVAQARGIPEERVLDIVRENTTAPLLGLIGTPRVNVLKLNVALDEATKG